VPATSQKQYAAMQAAAHGHSTLGIPRSVGLEFANATPHPSALPKIAPEKTGLQRLRSALHAMRVPKLP
jgi:hypothetical protein